MMRRATAVAVAVAALVTLPADGEPWAAADLGIGIEILPTDDESPGALAANSELWFATQPGRSVTRSFALISTTDVVQRVVFEIRPLIVVDGEPTISLDETSETAAWASFSPAELSLAPGQRQVVTMTYAIPPGTPSGAFQAYLRVLVSSDPATQTTVGAKVQAIVKGALAIKKSIWLGIGDSAALVTDLEIRGVAGWITDDGARVLRVLIENTGDTPSRPRGFVRLADPTFAERQFGPFEFRMGTLVPGDLRYAETPVSPEVTDGRWRVYVEATQGSVRKTRVFDVDLTFDRSLDEAGRGVGWLRPLAVGLLAMILVIAGVALMRGRRRTRRAPRRAHGWSVEAREAAFRDRLARDNSASTGASSTTAAPGQRPSMVRPSREARARRGQDRDSSGGIARPTQPSDVTARLRELKAMLDDGLITQEEHDAKRREILGRL